LILLSASSDIHYAVFFDPGFGYGSSDIKGTRAVLEVRAHEVPFLIEHEQFVGRLHICLCFPSRKDLWVADWFVISATGAYSEQTVSPVGCVGRSSLVPFVWTRVSFVVDAFKVLNH